MRVFKKKTQININCKVKNQFRQSCMLIHVYTRIYIHIHITYTYIMVILNAKFDYANNKTWHQKYDGVYGNMQCVIIMEMFQPFTEKILTNLF